MDYLRTFLITQAVLLVALVVAPWTTARAAGMRLPARGMAKYTGASLVAFYGLGFAIDIWSDGAAFIAMLASQLLLGVWWYPRCVVPRAAKPQGRRGWRWWAPVMLALLAEITFEVLVSQAMPLALMA